MQRKKTHKINVKGIIKHFGGQIEMLHNLGRLGYETVCPHAVDKWVERGTIPTKHLLNLQSLGREIGRPITLDDYISEMIPKHLRNVETPETEAA